TKPMVARPAVVAEQACRPTVLRQHEVRRAVTVNVGIGATPSHDRHKQVRPGLTLGHRLVALAGIPEELRRLFVRLTLLHLANLPLEMGVSRQQNPSAAESGIEETDTELE